jgi:hypothetical protein
MHAALQQLTKSRQDQFQKAWCNLKRQGDHIDLKHAISYMDTITGLEDYLDKNLPLVNQEEGPFRTVTRRLKNKVLKACVKEALETRRPRASPSASGSPTKSGDDDFQHTVTERAAATAIAYESLAPRSSYGARGQ